MTGMLLLSILAAAATVIEPDFEALIRHTDYPGDALRDELSAAAYVELGIGANGRVTECRMISSVGTESLAARICPIISKRRIAPARMPDGTASPARMRTKIMMVIPGTSGASEVLNAEPPPDLELSVKSLPQSVKTLDTSVLIAVGVDGTALACKAARYAKNINLVDVACNSVKAMKFDLVSDSGGQPTSYVTVQRVRFVASDIVGTTVTPPAIPLPAT